MTVFCGPFANTTPLSRSPTEPRTTEGRRHRHAIITSTPWQYPRCATKSRRGHREGRGQETCGLADRVVPHTSTASAASCFETSRKSLYWRWSGGHPPSLGACVPSRRTGSTAAAQRQPSGSSRGSVWDASFFGYHITCEFIHVSCSKYSLFVGDD